MLIANFLVRRSALLLLPAMTSELLGPSGVGTTRLQMDTLSIRKQRLNATKPSDAIRRSIPNIAASRARDLIRSLASDKVTENQIVDIHRQEGISKKFVLRTLEEIINGDRSADNESGNGT